MDIDENIDIIIPVTFLSSALTYTLHQIIKWKCLINSKPSEIETQLCNPKENDAYLKMHIQLSENKMQKLPALLINVSSVRLTETFTCKTSEQENSMAMTKQNIDSVKMNDLHVLGTEVSTCKKRKRGRPRKSFTKLDNKAVSPIQLSQGTEKRYGLRGVKLCESIMNAEKGIDGCKPVSSTLDKFECHDNTLNENHDYMSEDSNKVTEGLQNSCKCESSDPEHNCVRENYMLDQEISLKVHNLVMDKKISSIKINSALNQSNIEICTGEQKQFNQISSKPKKGTQIFHPSTARNNHSTKEMLHPCSHCPAKYKHFSVLKQHIAEIHEGKLEFSCIICQTKFARKNQYSRHMRSHGLDKSKQLTCTECGKGFWFNYNLKRHVELVHKKSVEKFHCSYCGKGFNLKGGMVTHVQQVHFNIFPFQCTIANCKMGFPRQKLLNDHMHQVHSDFVYKPVQYKRGRYKYGRAVEDLFYCTHCKKSFCYKSKLVEHMYFEHNDSFPFICEHCSQGFAKKYFLLIHLKNAHDKVIDEQEIEAAKTEKSDCLVSQSDISLDVADNCDIIVVTETEHVMKVNSPETSATAA